MIPSTPPFSQGSGNDGAVWAEMLARIGRQNCRLSAMVARTKPRQRSAAAGRTVLEELEKERTRIARDLHAGAGQPLAGIKMNLELIDGCVASMPEAAREAVLRLRTLTDQALAQVRAVSHRLHPPAWQQLSLGAALHSLVESAGFDARLELVLNVDALGEEPDHSVKVALYRCAQECLSNIARHAQATRVELALRRDGETIELEVRDNGRGLDPAAPKGSGIGLTAIREHASALGGTAEILSGPEGTRVRVRIPDAGDHSEEG